MEKTNLDEISQLKNEHHEIELRLAELESHLSLSPREQHERAELKKLKLAKKDEIQRLLAGTRARSIAS